MYLHAHMITHQYEDAVRTELFMLYKIIVDVLGKGVRNEEEGTHSFYVSTLLTY